MKRTSHFSLEMKELQCLSCLAFGFQSSVNCAGAWRWLRGSTVYLHSRLKSLPTLFALRTNIFPEVKSVWLDVQDGHVKWGALPGSVHGSPTLCTPARVNSRPSASACVYPAPEWWLMSSTLLIQRVLVVISYFTGPFACILLPCPVLALGSTEYKAYL